MPATIHIESLDHGTRKRIETLTSEILSAFDFEFPASLLCFFDAQDWTDMKLWRGVANRGFYSVFNYREPSWMDWPKRIVDRILVENSDTAVLERRFDQFIYLHQSTIATDVGLVMTFTHELQHFVQHHRQPKIYAASTVVTSMAREMIRQCNLTACDIPIEFDARLVAKRLANQMFGHNAVTAFIDSRIAANVTDEDVADWKFVRSIDAAAPYDAEDATRALYERLRDREAELINALRFCKNTWGDPAFDLVKIERRVAE